MNTAVLTGRQVYKTMKVFIVSQSGKVADITLQSSCHSEDESVIKVITFNKKTKFFFWYSLLIGYLLLYKYRYQHRAVQFMLMVQKLKDHQMRQLL